MILREHQPGLTFFLALPPDLLTGSLSFLDFPASFFLSGLGGCKSTTTRVNSGLQSNCNYESDLLTRDDLSNKNGLALMREIKQLQDRLMNC